MEYLLNQYLFDGEFQSFGSLAWLFPLLAGLFTWRRLRTYVQRAVIGFAAGSFLLEYLSTNRDLTAAISGSNNSPFYHIGLPILFWLMSRLYIPEIGDWLSNRRYSIVLTGFGLFVVINALWGDGFMNFPSLSVGVYSLIGILLPIIYMLELLTSLAIPRLDRDPLFIAASGMLIYFSGNFLLWIFLSYINFEYDFFHSIYRVNTVLSILLNLFLTGVILLRVENQKAIIKLQAS